MKVTEESKWIACSWTAKAKYLQHRYETETSDKLEGGQWGGKW